MTKTEWFDRTNFFFILGHGRSGTRWLADLLDQAHRATVCHEPTRRDKGAYKEAFYNSEAAELYIRDYRKNEIYERATSNELICHGKNLRQYSESHTIYGEVNSVLRRHCEALQKEFPDAKFIHIVRDARNVVRSSVSRTAKCIRPPKDDPWIEYWEYRSIFEKFCWLWAKENKYLRSNIEDQVKLELLVRDYDYFKERIIDPLELQLSRLAWHAARKEVTGATERFKLPPWPEWDEKLMKQFLDICGREMTENGYGL